MSALAVVLKPITCGWVIALTDGREIARFVGPGAKRRALRYVASPQCRPRSPSAGRRAWSR